MHICVMKWRKQEKVKSDQLASETLSSVSFPRKLVNLKKKDTGRFNEYSLSKDYIFS